MDEGRERKLAVILHADVVGSTALVRQHETLAHRRMQETFHALSESIARFGGRTREVRGDALVAEFDRASDAVSAALAHQHGAAPASEEAMVIQLRIGIALGEVVVADGTVTGAGVVLAQRLEQLASGGGICLHGAAYETVPQRMPFDFESIGEHRLKGFDEPIKAFAVSLQSGAALPEPEPGVQVGGSIAARPGIPRAALAGVVAVGLGLGILVLFAPSLFEGDAGSLNGTGGHSDQPRIAVLPFDNLSDDAEQAYFADGLAEDLITDLSKIPALAVTARSASFALRDAPGGLEEIADSLKVRYVLDGSVRRAGEDVRINARLVDAHSGQHVWSERFDRRLEDVFAIQDEVTEQIVAALEVSLGAGYQERVNLRRTANFDAYDTLLRALEVQSRFTPEDNAAGRALFEKAARLDPEYARAHAGVALTHAIDVNMNWTQDRQQSVELGLAAVNRALELDDSLPRAYFAQSALFLAQGRHEDAVKAGQHTVKLAPNYADGFAQLGFILANAGRHQDALAAIKRAKTLNPQYTQQYLYVEAMAHFYLEHYNEAVALLEVAVGRNPAFDRVHLLLAAAYGHLGADSDAAGALNEISLQRPDLSLTDERRDSVLARSVDLESYIGGLRKAGLPE